MARLLKLTMIMLEKFQFGLEKFSHDAILEHRIRFDLSMSMN